jgi:hypothetical protein
VFKMVKNLIEEKFPELDPKKMLPSMPDCNEFGLGDNVALMTQAQEAYRAQWKS